MSATRLVVSHTVRGKKTTTAFVLDPATIKQGRLKPGAKATVIYRFENNKAVASTVEVQGTKAPTKSGTTSGSKILKPKS